MSHALLRADAISKRFGAVVALQDASLELAAGEVTGLVGDNGAGKSTLVKIISGVLRPDAGSIMFDGNALISLHRRQREQTASRPSTRT